MKAELGEGSSIWHIDALRTVAELREERREGKREGGKKGERAGGRKGRREEGREGRRKEGGRKGGFAAPLTPLIMLPQVLRVELVCLLSWGPPGGMVAEFPAFAFDSFFFFF